MRAMRAMRAMRSRRDEGDEDDDEGDGRQLGGFDDGGRPACGFPAASAHACGNSKVDSKHAGDYKAERSYLSYQRIPKGGRAPTPHCGISVYKIGAMPKVLLFIKFGLIRLLPWRPLNCAPWFRAIKLQIADAREHHEFPRLRKYRFAAPTATRAIAVASRRQTRLPSRPS